MAGMRGERNLMWRTEPGEKPGGFVNSMKLEQETAFLFSYFRLVAAIIV